MGMAIWESITTLEEHGNYDEHIYIYTTASHGAVFFCRAMDDHSRRGPYV